MRMHTTAPLVQATSSDFARGYESGQVFYVSGQAQQEPDEDYLITNLNLLHEDGAFSDMRLFRWHIGVLMGMVAARRQKH